MTSTAPNRTARRRPAQPPEPGIETPDPLDGASSLDEIDDDNDLDHRQDLGQVWYDVGSYDWRGPDE